MLTLLCKSIFPSTGSSLSQIVQPSYQSISRRTSRADIMKREHIVPLTMAELPNTLEVLLRYTRIGCSLVSMRSNCHKLPYHLWVQLTGKLDANVTDQQHIIQDCCPASLAHGKCRNGTASRKRSCESPRTAVTPSHQKTSFAEPNCTPKTERIVDEKPAADF